MRTLDLALDMDSLDLPPVKEGEKPLTDRDLLLNWIINAANAANPNGLDMKQQRRLYGIIEKIEASPGCVIELEDAEFELCRESFQSAKFQSSKQVIKLLAQIYEKFDL